MGTLHVPRSLSLFLSLLFALLLLLAVSLSTRSVHPALSAHTTTSLALPFMRETLRPGSRQRWGSLGRCDRPRHSSVKTMNSYQCRYPQQEAIVDGSCTHVALLVTTVGTSDSLLGAVSLGVTLVTAVVALHSGSLDSLVAKFPSRMVISAKPFLHYRIGPDARLTCTRWPCGRAADSCSRPATWPGCPSGKDSRRLGDRIHYQGHVNISHISAALNMDDHM
jgi:hypothetical protein